MKYHAETFATKTIPRFTRNCPLLKSERLSVKSQLTLYKTLIKSEKTCLSSLGICSG